MTNDENFDRAAQAARDYSTQRLRLTDAQIDELFAIGNEQREQNRMCGVPDDGVAYMTELWLDALVEFQGLSPVVAEALRRRWWLPSKTAQVEQSEESE